MKVYWRLWHEVVPGHAPDQDFVAFDEAIGESIGRVYIMKHGPQEGRWRWSMTAHSTTGKVPFEIHGHEDSRGDAGRRVIEAYRLLLEHNQRNPRGTRGTE